MKESNLSSRTQRYLGLIERLYNKQEKENLNLSQEEKIGLIDQKLEELIEIRGEQERPFINEAIEVWLSQQPKIFFIDKPNFREMAPRGEKWMAIWKQYPELQEEMLKYKREYEEKEKQQTLIKRIR